MRELSDAPRRPQTSGRGGHRRTCNHGIGECRAERAMRRLHAWFLSTIAVWLVLVIPASSSVAAAAALRFAPEESGTGLTGSGGPELPTPRFVDIDFLGDTTRKAVSQDNRLVDSYVGSTADESLIFTVAKGTSFASQDKEPPAKIAVSVCPESVSTGANRYIIGDIYRVGAFAADGSAIGLDCSPEFQLSFNYRREDTREGTSTISFSRYVEEEGSWIDLKPPAGDVTVAWQVSAASNLAGIYAVTAGASPPSMAPLSAHIVIRNLTVSPATAKSGQPVTIWAEAVNTGWTAGERSLALRVSGSIRGNTNVTLAPGQSRELSYSISPGGPGGYEVQIAEAAGKFEVLGPARKAGAPRIGPIPLPGTDSRTEYLWPLLLTVFALSVICLLIVTERQNPRPSLASGERLTATRSTRKMRYLTAGKRLAPVLGPSQRRPLIPIVEAISGPTRGLKGPGPYRYGVKVIGGQPPYTIEWRGNGMTRTVTDVQHVDLLREQTWDNGKGNWVFVIIRDATGAFSEWLDKDGKRKRVFTYGVTRRGRVVKSPSRFPYVRPKAESLDFNTAIADTAE